jgi:hypothetical protein
VAGNRDARDSAVSASCRGSMLRSPGSVPLRARAPARPTSLLPRRSPAPRRRSGGAARRARAECARARRRRAVQRTRPSRGTAALPMPGCDPRRPGDGSSAPERPRLLPLHGPGRPALADADPELLGLARHRRDGPTEPVGDQLRRGACRDEAPERFRAVGRPRLAGVVTTWEGHRRSSWTGLPPPLDPEGGKRNRRPTPGRAAIPGI